MAGPGVGPDGNIYAVQNVLNGGIGAFSLDALGNLRWFDADLTLSSFPGSSSEIAFGDLADERLFFGINTQGSSAPPVWAYTFGGNQIWYSLDFPPGSPERAAASFPGIDPSGRIIVLKGQVGVMALDQQNGVEVLDVPPPGNIGNLVRPAIGPDGAIYTGTTFGSDLWAINPNGTTKWLLINGQGMPAHFGVSPDNAVLLVDGQPGFGSSSSVRAHDTSNGDLLWQVDLLPVNGLNQFTWTQRPAFAADSQTAYVTTRFASNDDQGFLYAIDVSGNPGGPQPNYNLAVSLNGSGTVTSNPAGINCPPDCSENYASGEGVALNATPDVGWTFDHWEGDCIGTGGCSVSMTANRSVTAVFTSSMEDLITITQAKYDAKKNKLTVMATSSSFPDATLTVIGIGQMTFKKGKYELKLQPAPPVIPQQVTVQSNFGGSATAAVQGAPPPPSTSLPGQATNPGPAGGATGVPVNAVLSWTSGADADSFNIYFGTAAAPGAGEAQGNQTGTSFDPGSLAAGTTYYWRIDAVNTEGITTGIVWSFTTASVTSTDVVTITKAEWKAGGEELKVQAISSEQPGAVLTLVGFGKMINKKGKYESRVKPVPYPGTVTVTSSLGGSATKAVKIR